MGKNGACFGKADAQTDKAGGGCPMDLRRVGMGWDGMGLLDEGAEKEED